MGDQVLGVCMRIQFSHKECSDIVYRIKPTIVGCSNTLKAFEINLF